MRSVRHLLCRDGRYFARLAVPIVLREIVGKRELLEPLGPDRTAALASLPAAIARFQEVLVGARQGIPPEPPLPSRSEPHAAFIVRHFRRTMPFDAAGSFRSIRSDSWKRGSVCGHLALGQTCKTRGRSQMGRSRRRTGSTGTSRSDGAHSSTFSNIQLRMRTTRRQMSRSFMRKWKPTQRLSMRRLAGQSPKLARGGVLLLVAQENGSSLLERLAYAQSEAIARSLEQAS